MRLEYYLSQVRAAMGIMHGSRAFGGPVRAGLSLTDRCNMQCIHCYFYSPLIDRPNMMPLRRTRLAGGELFGEETRTVLRRQDADGERTLDIIKSLLAMGTRSFQFSGSGEVFLHKGAMELMGAIKHAGASCLAYTNGTLLNPDMINELIEMRLDEMKVSTLAGTKETYICTHPGSNEETFDKLKENLLYLADRKASLGLKKPEIGLNFVVMSQNHDGIFDFAEFANIVSADRVFFHAVSDVRDPGLKKLVLTEEQSARVKEQMGEVSSYLESRGISHNIKNFLRTFRNGLETIDLYRVIPCYYGWLSVRIATDGEVYPCCRCYNSLGNVYKNSFHEIWHGDAYNWFRKEGLGINRAMRAVDGCDCGNCSNFVPNLRVYRLLHPIKGKAAKLDKVVL